MMLFLLGLACRPEPLTNISMHDTAQAADTSSSVDSGDTSKMATDTAVNGCLDAGEKTVVKSFESGDFTDWGEELAEEYSGTIVEDPVRCGDFAVRFEIREGDAPDATTGYRAELHELTDFIAEIGSEQWYAFSTYVPEDWPDADNRTVISQWHATPDLGDGETWRSPPLAVRYVAGELTVTSRSSSEAIQTENDAPEVTLYQHPEPWEKGIWHDWVFRVLWSYEDDGLVQAWLDGEAIIDQDGPVGYNDEVGVWFKWGIYRDDTTETQIIFHDEYRRGDSFDAVSLHR